MSKNTLVENDKAFIVYQEDFMVSDSFEGVQDKIKTLVQHQRIFENLQREHEDEVSAVILNFEHFINTHKPTHYHIVKCLEMNASNMNTRIGYYRFKELPFTFKIAMSNDYLHIVPNEATRHISYLLKRGYREFQH